MQGNPPDTTMTPTEEQQLIHGLSGIAQSVSAMLILLTEMNAQRNRMDKEMLDALKMIARKH
jgi:predicted protein tyrosine phosphatase